MLSAPRARICGWGLVWDLVWGLDLRSSAVVALMLYKYIYCVCVCVCVCVYICIYILHTHTHTHTHAHTHTHTWSVVGDRKETDLAGESPIVIGSFLSVCQHDPYKLDHVDTQREKSF